MALNPNIILAGRAPDVMGSMAKGAQTAQFVNDSRHTNDYRNALRDYGAGAMQGDQAALGQIAAFDPQAALGLQNTRQQMDVRASQEERAAQQFQMALEQMSKEEAAAESAKLRAAIAKAAATQTPEQWDAYMMSIGQEDLVGQFDNREAVLLQYMDLTDYIETQKGLKELRDGDSTTAMQTLEQRAAAAGLQPGTPEYQTFMANGGKPPSGMNLEVGPDGTVRFSQGANGRPDGRADVTSPEAMIASIDGILNDPALDFSTGWLAWTQNIPGTASRRFGARANQLEGQAFLQAFESLKGGGQITEIEGQKATQAIGRLDTAQRPEDYRAALEELRGILEKAQSRPVGWADSQGNAAPTPPQPGVTEDGYRFLGGDPADPNNWEKVDQ